MFVPCRFCDLLRPGENVKDASEYIEVYLDDIFPEFNHGIRQRILRSRKDWELSFSQDFLDKTIGFTHLKVNLVALYYKIFGRYSRKELIKNDTALCIGNTNAKTALIGLSKHEFGKAKPFL